MIAQADALTAGSLFTGIGGFDLGFERAGIKTIWQAEQDKNCLQLLEDKFPNARRYTDVRDITGRAEAVDIVTGGFPCQDVSVAGKRAGLDGERSGLWFEFHRIITELRPGWVVIENVPGLLSSNDGRDMGTIIGALAECGYGWAYRVLDAQFYGVAQRRRRVFIVGSLGNASAGKVLFEREGVSWDTPPRRETGQGTTAATPNSFGGYAEQLGTLRAAGGDYGGGSEMLTYNIQHNDGGSHKRKDRPNGGMYVNETDTALTVGSSDMTVTVGALQARDGKGIGTTIDDKIVPSTWTIRGGKEGGGKGYLAAEDKAMTLGGQPQWMGVRRLTPTECERLQGFPDGWTEDFSDSARYRMLGNAVAVPVIEWLANRIANV